MKNNFYYRTEIKFFTLGFLVGMYSYLLFIRLGETQYVNWAWLFWGTTAGFISLLWGGSYVLSRFSEIEIEFPADMPDGIQEKNIANQQNLDPRSPFRMERSQLEEASDEQIKDTLMFRSNKTLSLLHEAYEVFWLNYDPLRPPLQKQVTAFLVEKGLPARQAAELATAIKPDGLT